MMYERKEIVMMALGLIGLLVTIIILASSVLRDGVKETLKRFLFWICTAIVCGVVLTIVMYFICKGYGIAFEVTRPVFTIFTSFFPAFIGEIAVLEERTLRRE